MRTKSEGEQLEMTDNETCEVPAMRQANLWCGTGLVCRGQPIEALGGFQQSEDRNDCLLHVFALFAQPRSQTANIFVVLLVSSAYPETLALVRRLAAQNARPSSCLLSSTIRTLSKTCASAQPTSQNRTFPQRRGCQCRRSRTDLTRTTIVLYRSEPTFAPNAQGVPAAS